MINFCDHNCTKEVLLLNVQIARILKELTFAFSFSQEFEYIFPIVTLSLYSLFENAAYFKRDFDENGLITFFRGDFFSRNIHLTENFS